ncbi:MAG: hypothetical protein ABIT10_09655 [Alteraurantiacibacter sp.]
MKRAIWLIGGGALALTSSLALAQPEDLLPDIFNDPPAQPAPAPGPRATQAPTPRQTAGPRPTAPAAVQPGSSPVVQPLPGGPAQGTDPSAVIAGLPANFPTLAELEAMDEDELDELLGLKPKFDVPPGARRALERIGVIASNEGGFAYNSLAGQPAALVRAALAGTRGPMVSRWGHILVRRALASRLNAPAGMSPVEFAALRAKVLNGMGEMQVARALVQDVEGSNYDRALTDAAFDAYVGTGDFLGICAVSQLQPTIRDDAEWTMAKAMCDAYEGDTRDAYRRLQSVLGAEGTAEIDVRLAQRFAGAAGEGDRAVNIEWDGIDDLTPWRFSLANALGVDVPEGLANGVPARLALSSAVTPAVPLLRRLRSADVAAARGVFSTGAMVDLYGQLYASDGIDDGDKQPAIFLRNAYVADPAGRVAAMRRLWDGDTNYGRRVLTAYAAARVPVDAALADDAGELIASMLAAGLDRNAARWGNVVEDGSLGWALLALSNPAGEQVSSGDVSTFYGDDTSDGSRKSAFLLAGLAGLGRLDSGAVSGLASDMGVSLTSNSAWSQRIDRAGELRNPALVALLAGVGMQGDSWQRMTPRHLFHIVRALNAAGLNAEARMIAAEAVARG